MKARKFRSASDTPVSVYVPGRPDPIRVEPDRTYKTDDEAEAEALAGSPEVRELDEK